MFTKLSGNFKRAYVEEALGACNVFVGPNQSGKTSRLLGVRYALGGAEVGRGNVGVHGSAIGEAYAPPGADRLFAELAGPYGTARFDLLQDGGKWRDPARWPTLTGPLAEVVTEKTRERLLPMVAASDLLSLGGDLARRAFVRRFSDPETLFPEPAELDPAQASDELDRAVRVQKRAAWDQAKGAVAAELRAKRNGKANGGGGADVVDVADVLIALQKYWDARKRDAGAMLRSLEAARVERAAKGVRAAGAEALPELRARLATAEAWERATEARAALAKAEKTLDGHEQQLMAARARLQAVQDAQARDVESQRAAMIAVLTAMRAAPALDVDQQAALTRREAELHERHQALMAALEPLDAKAADLKVRLSTGETLLGAIDRSHSGNCPLCTKADFDATATRAYLAPIVEARRAELAAVEQERARVAAQVTQTAAAYAQALNATQAEERAAEQRKAQAIANAEAQLRTFDEANAQALRTARAEVDMHGRFVDVTRAEVRTRAEALKTQGAPLTYSGPSAADLKQQVEALREAEVADRIAEQDEKHLAKAKAEQAQAKEFERLAKDLLQSWTVSLSNAAERCVTKYLPPGYRAVLDANTRAWKLLDEREGVGTSTPRSKHSACGWELAMLVPALAAAYTEDAPVRILTLDDADLAGVGDENLLTFFAALKNATDQGWLTQVFVAMNRIDADHLTALSTAGWVVRRTVSDVSSAPFALPTPPPPRTAEVFPILRLGELV